MIVKGRSHLFIGPRQHIHTCRIDRNVKPCPIPRAQ